MASVSAFNEEMEALKDARNSGSSIVIVINKHFEYLIC